MEEYKIELLTSLVVILAIFCIVLLIISAMFFLKLKNFMKLHDEFKKHMTNKYDNLKIRFENYISRRLLGDNTT